MPPTAVESVVDAMTPHPVIGATAAGESSNFSRPACSECQRRKQKCDRQWPCQQCQKRKVAHMCQFRDDVLVDGNTSWKPSNDLLRKRDRSLDADDDLESTLEGIEAVGYTTNHLFAALAEADAEPRRINGHRQYKLRLQDSPALKRALGVLPARNIVDALVQNFLHTVNFYYYIVYPDNLLREYNAWWTDREKNRPLGLEWTCLLVMVCACSVQHTDAELGARLERELHMTPKVLTDKYHDAARELHSAIPVGQAHIYTVQFLLHSCYWFKAEARFEECWHVLGSAVREAQMLGLHLEKSYRGLADFDREMGRRLWCLVDAWDWLVSTLLARPLLIDRSDCDATLPALTLEKYPTSPMLHTKLQSELISKIVKRFGQLKNVITPQDALDYKDILETWMATFPPAYRFENPDTSQEDTYPWIALHRHYLHTISLAMILGPTRPYMAKNMTEASPSIEQELRGQGVTFALRLMGAVHNFFEYVWTRDTTFHFVPFCIFDTAALLCSAIIHDKDSSIPRREEILSAIDLALYTLKKLSSATGTAKTPHGILKKLAGKLPNPGDRLPHLHSSGSEDEARKKVRVKGPQRTKSASKKKQTKPAPPVNQQHAAAGDHVFANSSAPAPRISPQEELPQQFTESFTDSDSTYPASITSGSSPYTISSSTGSVMVSSLPTAIGASTGPQIIPAPPMPAPTTMGAALGGDASTPPAYANAHGLNRDDYSYPDNHLHQQHPPSYSHATSMPGLNAGPVSYVDPASGLPHPPPHHEQQHHAAGIPAPPPPPASQLMQQMGFENISDAELGDLASMWHWQSLDLDFSSNPLL